MEKNILLERIKEAKEKSKKRNFVQSWDISINLKNLNLKKPENRFSYEFTLPNGRGKETKTVVFADTLAAEAKKTADLVILKKEIDDLIRDKKRLKKIVNDYDWFFGEAPLMPTIAKSFGAVLGPRGKIPKPIPPKAKVEPFVKMTKKMVRVTLKETPVIHIAVGTEKMSDEEVAANIDAVINSVKERLPKGVNNIKSAHLKLTMGKPVRLILK